MAGTDQESTKLLVILSHILGLFTSFIGALVIYLVSENKTVKEHAKKAFNWQISLFIYFIVAGILSIILIGLLLMPVLFVLNLVFVIMASIKASEGEVWTYPLSIPFLK